MKNILNKIKRKYWYYKHRLQEFQICINEFKAGAKKTAEDQEVDFKSRMLLQVHRIEKGLGLEDCEPGHSIVVAEDLIFRMKEYIKNGYNIEDYAFKETFAVLNAYINYQRKYGDQDWPPLKGLERRYSDIVGYIGTEIAQSILASFCAGSYEVSLDELNDGRNIDFKRLVSSRHSMRMFSNKEISIDYIEQIIQIANKAPSACNRQPAKVYFVKDKDKVNSVDFLITGNHGFEGKIPCYAILAEDRAYFTGEEEFQWYINGGIYLSYLTLAMHSMGIGSCIMQWKAFHKNERELKQILGISSREAIIAIVGCGYYKENTRVICAQRKSIEETLFMI